VVRRHIRGHSPSDTFSTIQEQGEQCFATSIYESIEKLKDHHTNVRHDAGTRHLAIATNGNNIECAHYVLLDE
jgi:hypothetical protein